MTNLVAFHHRVHRTLLGEDVSTVPDEWLAAMYEDEPETVFGVGFEDVVKFGVWAYNLSSQERKRLLNRFYMLDYPSEYWAPFDNIHSVYSNMLGKLTIISPDEYVLCEDYQGYQTGRDNLNLAVGKILSVSGRVEETWGRFSRNGIVRTAVLALALRPYIGLTWDDNIIISQDEYDLGTRLFRLFGAELHPDDMKLKMGWRDALNMFRIRKMERLGTGKYK